ncbi:MAG: hypothetical protein LBB07_01480 [Bifidobacteriaceae bacterium]|jgi:hypothetical protein|nr:hypothetical protein [Bifidobacteriaceae bacterium]
MRVDGEIKISYVDLDYAYSKIKALSTFCGEAESQLSRIYSDYSLLISQYNLRSSYNIVANSIEAAKAELRKSIANLDDLNHKVYKSSEKFKETEKRLSQMTKINLGDWFMEAGKYIAVFIAGTANSIATNITEMLIEGEGFSAWNNFKFDTFESFLKLLKPSKLNVEKISSAVYATMGAKGLVKDSTLLLTKKHTDKQIEQRTVEYEKALPKELVSTYKKPANLEELAYKAGSINSYTFDGTTDVQIMVKEGNPPLFTILIPSTNEWSNVNGWPENFNILSGNSDLADIVKTALETEMQKRGITNFAQPKIMLAGFSMGGLVSAFFASKFSKQFNILQIVSFGAPIGGFAIPKSTKVLAYEFENDIVPQFDLKDNPKEENWETFVLPRNDLNSKGIPKPRDPVNVHYMTFYAPATKQFAPKIATDFQQFLSNREDRSDLDLVNYESKLIE